MSFFESTVAPLLLLMSDVVTGMGLYSVIAFSHISPLAGGYNAVLWLAFFAVVVIQFWMSVRSISPPAWLLLINISCTIIVTVSVFLNAIGQISPTFGKDISVLPVYALLCSARVGPTLFAYVLHGFLSLVMALIFIPDPDLFTDWGGVQNPLHPQNPLQNMFIRHKSTDELTLWQAVELMVCFVLSCFFQFSGVVHYVFSGEYTVKEDDLVAQHHLKEQLGGSFRRNHVVMGGQEILQKRPEAGGCSWPIQWGGAIARAIILFAIGTSKSSFLTHLISPQHTSGYPPPPAVPKWIVVCFCILLLFSSMQMAALWFKSLQLVVWDVTKSAYTTKKVVRLQHILFALLVASAWAFPLQQKEVITTISVALLMFNWSV